MLRSDAAVWSFANPVNVFLGAADGISGFDTLGGSANGGGFGAQVHLVTANCRAIRCGARREG
ncbi:hypothetical protein A3711_02805 [Erythrobacter sp. HI00D59]|nr:hypothetical protein A3711_02805 [Erythrobacter sp. HI00D59]